MTLLRSLIKILIIKAIVRAQESTELLEESAEGEAPEFKSLLAECDHYEYPEDGFSAQANPRAVYLRADPIGDGPFKAEGLTKFATAFGVRILGDADVPNAKIMHVTSILAQLLDQDLDGQPDNPNLIDQLRKYHASLFILSQGERIHQLMNAQNITEGFPILLKFCPFAFDFEESRKIQPHGKPGDATCEGVQTSEADRSLAFVVDHILGRGYPILLGPEKEEKLAKLYEDSVTAGTFVPSNTPCPPTSSDCNKVMYISWGMSSLLGFDKCWCEDVEALKFCTPAELQQKEPDLVEFLKTIMPAAQHIALDYKPRDKKIIVHAT